jgi:hypothetical protein
MAVKCDRNRNCFEGALKIRLIPGILAFRSGSFIIHLFIKNVNTKNDKITVLPLVELSL